MQKPQVCTDCLSPALLCGAATWSTCNTSVLVFPLSVLMSRLQVWILTACCLGNSGNPPKLTGIVDGVRRVASPTRESGDSIGMIERCREEHRLCRIYKIATTGELQHLPPDLDYRPLNTLPTFRLLRADPFLFFISLHVAPGWPRGIRYYGQWRARMLVLHKR